MSTQIRLADRLALILGQIEQLKEDMRILCETAEPTADEIAEVYWKLDDVPIGFLGPDRLAVLEIARAHPYWSWRCRACDAEVFVTSRNDKREREKPGRHSLISWLCEPCRNAERAVQTAAEAARQREAAARARQRVHELRTMPYLEYLQTPEWQERRKAALKRAGYSCQVCNRRRELHVHHRTYERRGEELARDLITLCDDCHALYHGKGLLAEHEHDE